MTMLGAGSCWAIFLRGFRGAALWPEWSSENDQVLDAAVMRQWPRGSFALIRRCGTAIFETRAVSVSGSDSSSRGKYSDANQDFSILACFSHSMAWDNGLATRAVSEGSYARARPWCTNPHVSSGLINACSLRWGSSIANEKILRFTEAELGRGGADQSAQIGCRSVQGFWTSCLFAQRRAKSTPDPGSHHTRFAVLQAARPFL